MEGRFDKSMAEIRKAQELDPLNTLIKIRIGYVYFYTGDFDSALQYFKKLVESEKDFPMGHHCLMEAYAMKKMYKEALEEGRRMMEAGAKTIANMGVLGTYSAMAGEFEKANKILCDMIVISYLFAAWHIADVFKRKAKKDATVDIVFFPDPVVEGAYGL